MSKITSAIIMVVGTSIGASMIAMPVSAVKVGFLGSIGLMMIIAWVMYYAAYTALDIYNITNSDSTIAKIAGKILNLPFKILCIIATLALLYSLVVAYISGLSGLISDATSFDYRTIVLSIAMALFISLSISHKIFDHYNRIAFLLKTFMMSVMIFLFVPYISLENLVASSVIADDYLSILTIIPVFVTSFGFHASIPFIYKFVDRSDVLYHKAIKYGVGITLFIYVIWLILTFGAMNHCNLHDNSLDDFLSNAGLGFFNRSINFFAIFAILTSLFGVATGLYDFLEEWLKDKFNLDNRWLISGMTFIPPFIFSLSGKDLFIKALSFAGCALTIIAIIVPILIRLKLDRKGNKLLLALCFLMGIMTIIGESLIAFHIID